MHMPFFFFVSPPESTTTFTLFHFSINLSLITIFYSFHLPPHLAFRPYKIFNIILLHTTKSNKALARIFMWVYYGLGRERVSTSKKKKIEFFKYPLLHLFFFFSKNKLYNIILTTHTGNRRLFRHSSHIQRNP